MSSELRQLSENEKLLYARVQEGATDEVIRLLNEKDVRVDCLDEQGMTLLQHAAYRGNYKLSKLLIDRGADVNSSYHDSGYSSLMFAGLSGKLDVASLLLEHGASTTTVNSVGRNAAQMAAFVGNHEIVSIINNFIPREDIEYFTQIHGLEKEAKLPGYLVTPLYKFVLKTNIHPVHLALILQDNVQLLKEAKRVVGVLEALCEKEIKCSATNELLALKFHHMAFVLRNCYRFYMEQKEQKSTPGVKGGLLEPLIRSWIKGNDKDGFPVLLEKFLRQSIREFPYHECALLHQLVRTLATVEIGDEPSALSILVDAVSGQKGCSEVQTCTTCGEPNAEKRCSACKSVQYCDQICQRLHWFTHKKYCPRLMEEYMNKKLQEEFHGNKAQKKEEDGNSNIQDSDATDDSNKDSDNGEEEFSDKCSIKDINIQLVQ